MKEDQIELQRIKALLADTQNELRKLEKENTQLRKRFQKVKFKHTQRNAADDEPTAKETAKAIERALHPTNDKPLKWYARSGNMARVGPFKSQVEAAKHIRLLNGGFDNNAFMWPEE
jgi:esterase/lipase